ncbi:MAG: IS66 family insertion sequence element accessory protein TnpB [SAR324 cluster bacterium]|nr:IS66 family insertion sequence element accessory protein TnpB [SAR324 cluster bacterium]
MKFQTEVTVYLATGTTDLRKSIQGLSVLIENELGLNAFSGHLFAFCNRSRTLIKILYWERMIMAD